MDDFRVFSVKMSIRVNKQRRLFLGYPHPRKNSNVGIKFLVPNPEYPGILGSGYLKNLVVFMFIFFLDASLPLS